MRFIGYVLRKLVLGVFVFLIGGSIILYELNGDFSQLLPVSFDERADYAYYVAPYVTNVAELDALIDRYDSGEPISDRDNIDALIQLGVVRSHPEWLTPDTLDKIRRLYPGMAIRKAEATPDFSPWIRTGFREDDEGSANLQIVAFAAPEVLVTSVFFVAAMAVILKNNPKMKDQLEKGYLTPSAISQIDNVVTTIGGPKNITRIAFAPKPKVKGQCTPEEEGEINDWYHDICDRSGSWKCDKEKNYIKNEVTRSIILACIAARDHAAKMCFNSTYDDKHRGIMEGALKKLAECEKVAETQAGNMSGVERVISRATASVVQMFN